MEEVRKLTVRNKLGMAHKAGLEFGAENFLKYYEYYRKYSSWLFVICLLISFIIDRMDLALISFGLLHLHLLFNQLWWKLKNIEHYYFNKEDSNNGNRVR